MYLNIPSPVVPEVVGEQASLLASWVRIAYRAAEQHGLDAPAIFNEADIDVRQLYRPDSRIIAYKVKKVWDRSACLSGDTAFGLKAAEAAYPGMYHSLSIMLCASQTLGELFYKWMRYRRIIDTQAINTLEESEEHLKFTWAPVTNFESDVGAEAMMACLIKLCRWSVGELFAPIRVTMQREATGDSDSFREYFKVPVEFDAEENTMYFSNDDLARPLLTADSVVHAKNEEITIDYLSRVLDGDTVNEVYSRLLSGIYQRKVSINLIAEEMNLSPRTLQRKLSLINTSYGALFDEVRREIALQQLNSQHLSVKEIGHLLGFSSASNFGRAFQRWVGVSPAVYQRKLR